MFINGMKIFYDEWKDNPLICTMYDHLEFKINIIPVFKYICNKEKIFLSYPEIISLSMNEDFDISNIKNVTIKCNFVSIDEELERRINGDNPEFNKDVITDFLNFIINNVIDILNEEHEIDIINIINNNLNYNNISPDTLKVYDIEELYNLCLKIEEGINDYYVSYLNLVEDYIKENIEKFYAYLGVIYHEILVSELINKEKCNKLRNECGNLECVEITTELGRSFIFKQGSTVTNFIYNKEEKNACKKENRRRTSESNEKESNKKT